MPVWLRDRAFWTGEDKKEKVKLVPFLLLLVCCTCSRQLPEVGKPDFFLIEKKISFTGAASKGQPLYEKIHPLSDPLDWRQPKVCGTRWTRAVLLTDNTTCSEQNSTCLLGGMLLSYIYCKENEDLQMSGNWVNCELFTQGRRLEWQSPKAKGSVLPTHTHHGALLPI